MRSPTCWPNRKFVLRILAAKLQPRKWGRPSPQEWAKRSNPRSSPATSSLKADSMRATVLFFFSLLFAVPAPSPQTSPLGAYLGFDRNDYPDDATLPILRKSFSFIGYLLTSPPSETSNPSPSKPPPLPP